MLKKMLPLLVGLGLLLHGTVYGSLSAPKDMELIPHAESITVNWTANSDDTDYYMVMWGESEKELNSHHTIEDEDTETYVIESLDTDTTYYVKIRAYDSKGSFKQTEALSAKTVPPIAPPANFDVTRDNQGIIGLTENQIALTWDPVSDKDLVSYTLSYGTSEGSYPNEISDIPPLPPSYTLTGMQPSTRYYLVIQSIDDEGKESIVSDELIVDTLPDLSAPKIPAEPTVELAGSQRILVSFSGNNSTMADLKGYRVYIKQTGDGTETLIDIGAVTDVIMGAGTDFPQVSFAFNTTYTVSIAAYDYSGNASDKSISTDILIEDTQDILIGNDEVKTSCFISSANSPVMLEKMGAILFLGVILISFSGSAGMRRFLLVFLFVAVSVGNAEADQRETHYNTVGLKAGYFFYTEKLFEDTYEDDYPIPVLIYYERNTSYNLFMDVEVGFMRLEGVILTKNNRPSIIQSQYDVMPVSASIGYKYFFNPQIYGYLGAGPDLWQLKETHRYSKGEEENVDRQVNMAGCHVKSGIAYIFKENEFVEDTGVQLECAYSVIDDFGKSDLDFGGLAVQAGLFFLF